MNKIATHLLAAAVGASLVAGVVGLPLQLEIDLRRAAALRSAAREAEHDKQIAAALDIGRQLEALQCQAAAFLARDAATARNAAQELQVRLDRAEAALAANEPLRAALKELSKQVEAALAAKPVSPPPVKAATPAPPKVKPTPVPPQAKPATPAPPKVKPVVAVEPTALAFGVGRGGRVDPAAMVAAHNRWRSEVGVPGLKWSVDLADKAQKWADHLAASKCSRAHSGPGENIYWAGPAVWPDGRREFGPVNAQNVVDLWASEREQWDNATGHCSGVCGHYTQVVWKDSKDVGCAMAVCGNKAQIWVCNYFPAGNVVGQKPY
jgi:pathogenesis-related protein 1